MITTKTKPCQACRTSTIRGVRLHGPVLGVRLVEACPDCRVFQSDAEAAEVCSRGLDLATLEQDGKWYLDELAKDKVEPLIVQDLDNRRERAKANTTRLPWE